MLEKTYRSYLDSTTGLKIVKISDHYFVVSSSYSRLAQLSKQAINTRCRTLPNYDDDRSINTDWILKALVRTKGRTVSRCSLIHASLLADWLIVDNPQAYQQLFATRSVHSYLRDRVSMIVAESLAV